MRLIVSRAYVTRRVSNLAPRSSHRLSVTPPATPTSAPRPASPASPPHRANRRHWLASHRVGGASGWRSPRPRHPRGERGGRRPSIKRFNTSPLGGAGGAPASRAARGPPTRAPPTAAQVTVAGAQVKVGRCVNGLCGLLPVGRVRALLLRPDQLAVSFQVRRNNQTKKCSFRESYVFFKASSEIFFIL